MSNKSDLEQLFMSTSRESFHTINENSPTDGSEVDEVVIPQYTNTLNGTVTGTVINMLHNILGVGVLSIAITLYYGSLVIALMINALMCMVSIISTFLTVDMMVLTQVTNWNGLIQKAFNKPRIARTTVGIISLTTFFSSVAFAIIAIDGIVNSGILSNRIYSGALVFIITLPLALIKNMEALKFSSTLGLFGIGFASAVVVYFAVTNSIPASEKGDVVIIGYNFSVFMCFAIFALSYAMQYNVPRFYCELRQGSSTDEEAVRKMKKATIISNVISLIWYTVTGVAGYLCFGDKSTGDILNAFVNEGNIIKIVRLVLSASIITSIPLTLHCCRQEFISLLFGKYKWNTDAILKIDHENENDSYHSLSEEFIQIEDKTELPSTTRKWISTIILALICLIASTISKIEILLSFKGATLISFIVFFLPTICAYKLKPRNWKWRSFVLTSTGLICTIFGLIAAIQNVQ